jgi:hypothetical protein
VNRAIEEQLKKQQHETFTPVFTRPQRYRDVYPFHAAHIVSCFLPGPRSSRYKVRHLSPHMRIKFFLSLFYFSLFMFPPFSVTLVLAI